MFFMVVWGCNNKIICWINSCKLIDWNVMVCGFVIDMNLFVIILICLILEDIMFI